MMGIVSLSTGITPYRDDERKKLAGTLSSEVPSGFFFVSPALAARTAPFGPTRGGAISPGIFALSKLDFVHFQLTNKQQK